MKFCTNCGTKLDDSAMFCYNCGTRCQIQPAPVAPVAPAAPVMPAAPAAPAMPAYQEAPAAPAMPMYQEAPAAPAAPMYQEAPAAPTYQEAPAEETVENPAPAADTVEEIVPPVTEEAAPDSTENTEEKASEEMVVDAAPFAPIEVAPSAPVAEAAPAGFQAPPAPQFNQAPQYNQAPQFNQAPPFDGQPQPQVYGQPQFQPNGQYAAPEAAPSRMDARRNKAIGTVSDAVSGGAGVVLAISFVASTIFAIINVFTHSGTILNTIVALVSKLGSIGEGLLDLFGPALESLIYSGNTTSIVTGMIGLIPAILSTIGLLILLFGKNKRPLTSAGFTLMKVAAVIMVVCVSIAAGGSVILLIIGLVSANKLSSFWGRGVSGMASNLLWVILLVVAVIFTLVILFYAKKARTITIIRNAASTGDYSYPRPSMYYVVISFIVVLFEIIGTIGNWKTYMDFGIFSAAIPVTSIIQTVCSITAAITAPIVVCKARSAMNSLD